MNENMTYDDRTIAPGIVGKTMIAGRYCVVRKLGEGGMGTVWLAEDTKLKNHLVAIKMLPSILVNNKRAYEQVQKEALVTLDLAHPNIATVRAFEEDNGNHFLVMDYIDGQTLDDYLAEKGTLTEAETIKLLKPVADALDYAHTQGVVHRDVKPGNVMVDKDGTPYILDFGIAREVQETMTRVTGKQSSGTLMYMSPEQLHGAEPDAAQDVYSFAAMAYECLKGKPPFSRGQIEFQIDHDSPAPLDSSIAISGSVMAGLKKTPEERPKSCAAVLAGGTRVQRDRPSVRPSGGKSRIAAVFIGALAVLAVGGGIWWGIGREQSKPAPQVVEKVVEKVVRQPAKIVTNVVEKVVYKSVTDTTSVDENKSHLGPKIGDTKTITLPGGVKMEMMWCPAGSFMMGSPESEAGRDSDETQHRVTLTEGFWMGKYEVTQAQWESVMGSNPSRFKGADRPVERVSWDECHEFIRKINASGEVKVSLPTEAQWEYACRAGSTTSLPNGKTLRILGANNGPALDEIAWYGGNSCVDFELSDGCDCSGWSEKQYSGSKAGTHPVGKKLANDWGLHDMIGNVRERCQDTYDADYYGKSPSQNPLNTASGTLRVGRGGSWYNYAQYCRSAYRGWNEPGYRLDYLGLRLVGSAGPRR